MSIALAVVCVLIIALAATAGIALINRAIGGKWEVRLPAAFVHRAGADN